MESKDSDFGSLTVWPRSKVAESILAGQTIVIYHDLVLRITPAWLDAHPGGMLAILHYVGRNATDEIEAYHPSRTLKRVVGFAVGRVEIGEIGWEPFIPPVQTGWIRKSFPEDDEWFRTSDERRAGSSDILTKTSHNYSNSEVLLVEKRPRRRSVRENADGPTLLTITSPPSDLSLYQQAQHARAYRELHRNIMDAGLYQTRYLAGYGPEFARYLLLGLVYYLCYSRGWFIPSAIFLGLLWHQLTFIAHDLGHVGVTHDWVLDRLGGILIAGCCGGLSIGWWVDVSVGYLQFGTPMLKDSFIPLES